jgi:coenzyme F420-reducing hydrogenase gamma subunit
MASERGSSGPLSAPSRPDGLRGRDASEGGARPRLGVLKLASCDGCQLTLLGCEDELLALGDKVDIAHFPEASSRTDPHGRFDVVLVEGSVSAESQREELLSMRARTKLLVTLGACATSGGVQALRNGRDIQEFVRAVYASPEYISTLEGSSPVSAHVAVDYELRGCPIDKRQLLEVLTAFLVGRRPAVRDESVCMECKRRGNVCVLVAHGEPCLGPVVHAGCGALCPTFARGCYGCFGPKESPATAALAARLRTLGVAPSELVRRFRGISGAAPAFAEEAARQEREHG